MQPLPFFSSPPFLLLAPSFSPFPFPVILELLGLKKPSFWRLFTQMTANFLRLVFKKSVRYKWALLISFESKNYFVICTSKRLIIIHIKEYIKRAAIMKELYGLKNTVNDLIDANSQINASYLKNASSTMLSLYKTPLCNKRSLWHLLQNTRNWKKGSKSFNLFSFLCIISYSLSSSNKDGLTTQWLSASIVTSLHLLSWDLKEW